MREFLVFGIKQSWACLFGALMLIGIIATGWWYPDGASLARNDLLVILAVLIQTGMLVLRLETGRELWGIVLFHFLFDVRLFLVLAVTVVFFRCRMHFRIHRRTLPMPVLLTFVLVAFFIWIAENIGTATGAWLYPSQVDGWQMVPVTKLVAWFLLMMISVVLVTFVYPPKPPADADAPDNVR